MSSPKAIRWGILATGAIAKTFTKDILLDPSTRNVTTIKHTVVAAGSSTSISRAQQLLDECACPPSAKAYGSYSELVHDPDVDIVYIATPHSHHFQNAMLCLEAGKNVLCEKAFTVNAAQAKRLAETAREKDLFLMEAMWMRYFPLSIYVCDTIKSGRLGRVYRCVADNSLATNPETTFTDGKHRLVNPDLAGGALLDLGIYSLTWCFMALYNTQPANERKPPRVLSTMNLYPKTVAADEMTSILLTFPRSIQLGGDAHAIATTSMRVATDPHPECGPCVRIQGDQGEIQVFPPPYRPTRTRLVLLDGTVEEKNWPQPGPGEGSGWYNGFGVLNPEGEGHGMFWEADEAGKALLEGRKESTVQGIDETILIMKVMDIVRKEGGLNYPYEIETTNYPI